MDKEVEIKYLSHVNGEVKKQIKEIENYASSLQNRIISEQKEFRENRSSTKFRDLKKSIKEINARILSYDDSHDKLHILKENLNSAFFGGIVFDGDKYYIGKFSIQNSDGSRVLVHDWRAPISSVFYEFELGDAYYFCPMGEVRGELSKKMQYKIEKGELVYMFDTSVTIRDEILQQALVESASTKMKTIVSTIQKKQNEIIRLPFNQSIVVQGVAGSGKTSIALHRIAYILYNNRKNLTSKNILVFSPNNVFSSYISSVLPELGEQPVKETSFDEIFKHEFAGVIGFEKRHVAIEKMLSQSEVDEQSKKAYEYKTSEQCLADLNRFLNAYFEKNFIPKNINYKSHSFTAETISELVNSKKGESIYDRLNFVASGLVSRVEAAQSITETASEMLTEKFVGGLISMLKQKNVFKIYASFLTSKKLKFKKTEILSFEDAINVLYIKNYIFGAHTDKTIKHVVIDEMQDYSPIALNVIKQMYKCSFTCLGDIYQTIDSAFNNQKLNYITNLFADSADKLELKQNYRSTYQIASFANKVLGLTFSERPIRNGAEPLVVKAENASEQIVAEAVKLAKKHKTVGIICKTMAEARSLYVEFKNKKVEANLIRPESMGFAEGITISAAHVVKGLEFDAVVVANANNENYKTEIDRQSLYVAITRALHEVAVVYTGEITKFLK